MSLTGTYRLVRHESRFSDGEVQHTYGESPEGLLVYTDSGYYTCQAMKAGVAPVQFGEVPARQKRSGYDTLLAAIGGYTGTFGTYTVDEAAGTVTHHIIGAWLPNAVGKDDEMHFEQVEGGLVFGGDSPIELPDGRSLITQWTWSRIS